MNANIDITGVALKTERLLLRPFEERDLKDFNEYASVEGVGEMAGWFHHQSIEETQKVLTMFIEGKKTFAIEKDGKVIGSFGIESYNEELLPEFHDLKARELGFILGKPYWGQGLMAEAGKAVIQYLFDTVGLDAVVCGYFKRNQQSKRVQEKLGFTALKDYIFKNNKGFEEAAVVNVLYKQGK